MARVAAKTGGFSKHHSWKMLLIISGIIALLGIGDMIQGMSADPAIAKIMTSVLWEEFQRSNPKIANLIDLQVRKSGAQVLALSILSIICLTGYRRGERWAWSALLSYPLYMMLAFITFLTADRQADFPPPPPLRSAPVFFVIGVPVLLLSYREFPPLTSKKY